MDGETKPMRRLSVGPTFLEENANIIKATERARRELFARRFALGCSAVRWSSSFMRERKDWVKEQVLFNAEWVLQ